MHTANASEAAPAATAKKKKKKSWVPMDVPVGQQSFSGDAVAPSAAMFARYNFPYTGVNKNEAKRQVEAFLKTERLGVGSVETAGNSVKVIMNANAFLSDVQKKNAADAAEAGSNIKNKSLGSGEATRQIETTSPQARRVMEANQERAGKRVSGSRTGGRRKTVRRALSRRRNTTRRRKVQKVRHRTVRQTRHRRARRRTSRR